MLANQRPLRTRLLTAATIVLLALDAGVAAAQSQPPTEAASPGPSPSLPAPTVLSGSDPAFSIALPLAWQAATSDALLQASGPGGATLLLVNEAMPTEATFDGYVARVERDLEKAAATDLPTTFRQAGPGLMARIETATHHGRPTALFLFPACPDGARTLTIAGAPVAAETPGGLDAWDHIAATVNPCAVDPALELVLDPAAAALGPRYLELSAAWIRDMTAVYGPLAHRVPVRVWNRQMKQVATIELRFMDGVTALPWTPETQPLAAAWRATHETFLAAYRGMARAKTVRTIDALQRPLDDGREPAAAAAAALRFGIGLATYPQ